MIVKYKYFLRPQYRIFEAINMQRNHD